MKRILPILLTLLIALGSFPALAREYTTPEMASILKEIKIMEGDPNGDLRLPDPVTRGEFTKMAINASPYKNLVATGISVSPFQDVPYSYWGAPYILVALEGGIVNGYPDATFRPQQHVKLEEALTILLKLLGYTDQDFGLSYPYGQYALAEKLEMLDGVYALLGQDLTREHCLILIYNFLNTPQKGSPSDYIQSIGYSLVEDSVITATNETDSAVPAGYVITSTGTYRIPSVFDSDWIGRRGTILLKNGNEMLTFLPDVQEKITHTVYQVLGNKIITFKDSRMEELDLEDGLRLYHKSSPTSLAVVKATLSTGDTITLYRNASGELEYGTLQTDDLKGPFTATGPQTAVGFGLTSPTVTKNGAVISADEIKANDILYYSPALQMIWCYQETVTGVYTKASPNQDMPTSVTLSGREYAIESSTALSKLSSGGAYAVGDTITLLLGKDGRIADVTIPDTSNPENHAEVSGYLYQTGTRVYTKNQESYSGYYASIVLPDGTTIDYETKKDYTELRNSMVHVSFQNALATVTRATTPSGFGGVFEWDERQFGNAKLAASVKILDVADLEKSATGLYVTVPGQRLDGLSIKQNSILYAKTNDSGEINALILKEVTGDMYRYGVVSESGYSNGSSKSIGGTTAYYDNGTEIPILSSNTVFRYSKGTPVAVARGGNNTDTVKALSALSGKVDAVTDTTIMIGNTTYPLWDKVTVYRRIDAGKDFSLLPLSEIKENTGYRLTAYVDKPTSSGGRVRIIVAES